MTAREKRSQPTINDVAETAGVAVGTVSRYLNGLDIRKGNRQQIERAIETLGYQRNAVAKAMKTDRTGLIGLLVPEFDEFHAQLLTHLSRGFRQCGATVLIYCHDGDSGRMRDAVSFFVSQRVDALVLAGSPDAADLLGMMTERGIPVVIYNNDVAGPIVDRVFSDNESASFRAVRLLIDMGHHRIAHIAGDQNDSSARNRLEGYERALQSAGIAICEDYQAVAGWSIEGGYHAVEKFMALKNRPTALFCANYKMTIGVLEWLREHELRTPDDVAIVSFDDVELFRLYDKGITAIAQPVGTIAESIVTFVTSRLQDSGVPDIRSRTLDCNIIVRGSSRKPRNT